MIALRQCSGKPGIYERFGYLKYNNTEQYETDGVEWLDGMKKTEVTIRKSQSSYVACENPALSYLFSTLKVSTYPYSQFHPTIWLGESF